MKKFLATMIMAGFVMSCVSIAQPALAAHTHGTDGKVSGKSVGAAALSLLIWPGIGQMVNEQSTDKVVTHALLGLTGIFRIWSCYDALVDRNGGVWNHRI